MLYLALFAVFDLGGNLYGYAHLIDQVLKPAVLHDGFKVLTHLVFVAGIGMHHIPFRLGISFVCH